MLKDEWVVFGNQGEYRANKDGVIQSRVRKGKSPDGKNGKRIVEDWIDLVPKKERTDKSGGYYYVVSAGLNGKTRDRLHSIICSLFHGGRPSVGYEIDHIDGNRDNNSASNLRWVTHKENMEYAKQRGAWERLSKEAFPFKSEEEFLSIMTQINAGIGNIELERRYGKDRSIFSRLTTMTKQVGFVHRHRWLSKKILKDDFFGGHKNFPLEEFK